ncbi:GTP-binding protein [Streptococcus sp. S784/96/1]|uniref:GTP-binding protein n=1 Tax=Streptococcus sp. S784/96/1 TaxID=2653499 RepID=UPI0012EA0B6F
MILTESLLYHAGVNRQLGKVAEDTDLTDNLQMEKEREISVKAPSISFIHNDVRLNLLDTSGYVDFVSEVERAFSIHDTGIGYGHEASTVPKPCWLLLI